MFEKIKSFFALIGIVRQVESEYKDIKQEALKMGKSWYTSKTLWFNIVTGLMGVIAAIKASGLVGDPKAQAAFVIFVAVGNMILRLITDQPITTGN